MKQIEYLQAEIVRHIRLQVYESVIDLFERYSDDPIKVKEWIVMWYSDLCQSVGELSQETKLRDVNTLSTRAMRAIYSIERINMFEDNLKDLANISVSELMKLNQVGNNTINEIQKLLATVGLKLMD